MANAAARDQQTIGAAGAAEPVRGDEEGDFGGDADRPHQADDEIAMPLRAKRYRAERVDDGVARLNERAADHDKRDEMRLRDRLQPPHAIAFPWLRVPRREKKDASGGEPHDGGDDEDHGIGWNETDEPAADNHQHEYAGRARAAHGAIIEQSFACDDAAARLAQHDGIGERDHRPLAEGAGDDAEKDEPVDRLDETRRRSSPASCRRRRARAGATWRRCGRRAAGSEGWTESARSASRPGSAQSIRRRSRCSHTTATETAVARRRARRPEGSARRGVTPKRRSVVRPGDNCGSMERECARAGAGRSHIRLRGGAKGCMVAGERGSAMKFPTTIAGSLPKPAWLAEPEKLWGAWRADGAELRVSSATPRCCG